MDFSVQYIRLVLFCSVSVHVQPSAASRGTCPRLSGYGLDLTWRSPPRPVRTVRRQQILSPSSSLAPLCSYRRRGALTWHQSIGRAALGWWSSAQEPAVSIGSAAVSGMVVMQPERPSTQL
ncbi:hypothetical protein F5B17DRAFT_82343 [Nemania serpens]|nr:hypothetical protein F5B17DRAFT_82343 [Nemania serpens]